MYRYNRDVFSESWSIKNIWFVKYLRNTFMENFRCGRHDMTVLFATQFSSRIDSSALSQLSQKFRFCDSGLYINLVKLKWLVFEFISVLSRAPLKTVILQLFEPTLWSIVYRCPRIELSPTDPSNVRLMDNNISKKRSIGLNHLN